MKTKDMPIWSVIIVITIALVLFWLSALVYGYVVDDLSSTPAPRSY